MNKIESALRLASEGFYVFPVVADGKMPAVKGWQDKATRDHALISRWWTDDPDYNIGLFTGRYEDDRKLLVVDVDVKNDKNGMASWKNLRSEHGLRRTRTNSTPSDGRHIIYVTDEPVRSSAEKLATGIDVRSSGGFIVGPGSVIDGKAYSSDWTPIEQASSALVGLCGRPRDKQTKQCDIENLDLPATVDKAETWLKDGSPHAIEGRHGDQTTFQVAAHLKDMGLSELVTLDLMFEHWNATKADPPWEYAELARKVTHAYRYGANAIGSNSAQADFEVVPVHPSAKQERSRLYWVEASDVTVDLDRVDLIRGLLSEEAMSIIYGESNTGKTFLTIKMAYCIATGRPFNGQRVEQGAVVYVAAEAGRSIHNRVVALKQHFGVDKFPMAVVPCPVDLLKPDADTDALIDIIEEYEATKGQKVKFVVIDTLSRALAGGNENSPDDMGAFVMNVDRIRHATKTHLCIVHHSGKDKARGARGHSLLRAGTDTELEVANNQLKATKQRDRENGLPVAFELTVHGLGTNAYGEAVTSCVLEELEQPAADDFDDMSDRERAALDCLVDLAKEKNPVDVSAWRDKIRWTLPISEIESEAARIKAIQRLRTWLVDTCPVSYSKEDQTLRYEVDMEVDTENG